MAQINSYISNYEVKSYANSGGQVCKVDCSLGVNSDKIPDAVLQALGKISADTMKYYPHSEAVIEKLVEKFRPVAALEAENFVLGCGSIDLLFNLNMLYLNSTKALLGYAPQFSAYVDHVHFMGAKYIPYLLQKKDQYAFHVDAFLKCLDENEVSMVYIDNPNNPTGQVIPLEEIEKIVIAADKKNAAVVIDEAYGEYMPLENSAASLVQKYNHLFVAKSFSKGYGLAGMRMGYVIGEKEPMEQLKKLVTPFNCNSIARAMAMAMLDSGNDLETLLQRTEEKKKAVLSSLHKIKVSVTAPFTPIMLLYTQEDSLDLCDILYQAGIATVSGASFDNLGKNAVRLMLCEDTELLIQLLQEAEKNIPE